MANADVIMPKMGDGMVEGTLLAWKKRDGDEVKLGDVIAEIETDKSNVEIEAEDVGVLRTQVAEGASVPVGGVIATIGDGAGSGASAPSAQAANAPRAEADSTKNISAAEQQKMAIDAPAPPAASAAPSAAAQNPAPSPAPQPAPAPAPQRNGVTAAAAAPGARIKASPLARKVAREHGVALEALAGTGPNGRIVEADVKAAAAQPRPQPAAVAQSSAGVEPVKAYLGWTPSSIAGERVSMSSMRNVIGRRMVESKGHVPHFYLTVEVDMDAAMDLRKQLNTLDDSLAKISLNDFVVKASALALRKVPDVNRIYQGDAYIQPASVNVGIAVALDDGLIVPVVKDADTKSLRSIAKEARALIDKARGRKLLPNDYNSGTFTVSNLGSFDIDNFIAIIDPSQGAILAVGSIRKMPVVLADDTIAVRSRMNITLSGDHRVMDGAAGAKFLQEAKRLLQSPLALLEH